MFTPEFFTVLKQVTDAMFFLPGIDRTQVFSILTPNVRYIEVVEDGIIAGNVLPAGFRPTEAGLARVRENAIKAGVVGRLVANDFTGAIVSGRLQEFHPNTGERLDYIEVAGELEEIRGKAESSGARERAHHRLRQAGGGHRRGRDPGDRLLRHHDPDHRPVCVSSTPGRCASPSRRWCARWWRWCGSLAR